MQLLSPEKLKIVLANRNLSLHEVCRQSGISRQSLYNMMKGSSIYNVPFTKLITHLRIDPFEITETETLLNALLKKAPLKIQKVILKLQEFCQKHNASLILFGSQVTGKATVRSDWDFGMYFFQSPPLGKLSLLKQRLIDKVFPYRIDIICLNQAPSWFQQSVWDESLLLWGSLPITEKEVV